MLLTLCENMNMRYHDNVLPFGNVLFYPLQDIRLSIEVVNGDIEETLVRGGREGRRERRREGGGKEEEGE